MSKAVPAQVLGIQLSAGDEAGLFKWFIASFLMGKRIQANIAVQAYQVIVEQHGCNTPQALAERSHRQLVAMLGAARYVRYDESTAARLSLLAHKLIQEYDASLLGVHSRSGNRADFEKRLLQFDGVGPKTVEIFMTEAAQVLF
jgi:endonuclease III